MPSLIAGKRDALYLQVARSIKQRVRKGIYLPGKQLPTVRALSDELGVSVKVIYRGLQCLKQEGIVIPHHGRGVMVADAELCNNASILFGMIHPFEYHMTFSCGVVAYAEKAIAASNDLLVMRSSEGDYKKECDIAQQLVKNGVQGLLLWPEEMGLNGPFFNELSKKIPVVVVDRSLVGWNGPTVVLDVHQAGQSICSYMLGELGCSKMLVLVDDATISPNSEMVSGLRAQASKMSRSNDIIINQLSILPLIAKLNNVDYSEVEDLSGYLEDMIGAGGYDALFCAHDEFIDAVIIQTGLYKKFPDLKIGSMRGPVLVRSKEYMQYGISQWYYDYITMLEKASNLLHKAVVGGEAISETIRLEVPRYIPDA